MVGDDERTDEAAAVLDDEDYPAGPLAVSISTFLGTEVVTAFDRLDAAERWPYYGGDPRRLSVLDGGHAGQAEDHRARTGRLT